MTSAGRTSRGTLDVGRTASIGILCSLSLLACSSVTSNAPTQSEARKGGEMAEMEWGPEVEGWQMSISVDQEQSEVDHQVLVTIVTKNVSSEELSIPITSKWTTYRYTLQRDGVAVPRSRFGERMEESRGEGSAAEPILPGGDTIVLELPISRLFDLSLIGRYGLTIERPVFRRGSRQQTTLTSNELSFEIFEK